VSWDECRTVSSSSEIKYRKLRYNSKQIIPRRHRISVLNWPVLMSELLVKYLKYLYFHSLKINFIHSSLLLAIGYTEDVKVNQWIYLLSCIVNWYFRWRSSIETNTYV